MPIPRRSVPGPLAGALLATLALAGGPASSAPLGRADEPVVLTATDLPSFAAAAPATIVGFAWDGAWRRIAVQVDERHVVDFGDLFDREPVGATVLTFSDPGTYSGPDPDPGFDGDDELVFLAGDASAGAAPTDAAPTGTSAASRTEIALRDPDTGAITRIYLFLATGAVAPVAEPHRVEYDFVLLSGDYRTTYDFDGCTAPEGCNPEASTVTTDRYRVRFSDRWIRDETRWIDPAGNAGPDRIDRHKTLFAPGQCGRSELTFSRGQGAFLVNRAGPVRALRGYVGANSGPTTYRIHAFYPAREVILSVLRVHPIPGVVDFYDYAPGLGAMTYFNDLVPDGVAIDGVPDAVPTGDLRWEAVRWDEAGGVAAHVTRIDSDVPGLVRSSYYADDATPLDTQCTGDDVEHGASGFRTFDLPNTDDSGGAAAYRFRATRTIRWNDEADAADGAASARHLAASVDRPLEVAVRGPGGGSGTTCADADLDGAVDCRGGCIPPPGTTCGECDDADPGTRPGASELCDGRDRDCNGTPDDVACGTYDWSGDGRVDAVELVVLGLGFGGCDGASPADLDDDGCVDGDDLALLAAVWARSCDGPFDFTCP